MVAEVVEQDPQVLSNRAKAHEYPIFLIHLAMAHLVNACVSFRGIEGSFKAWSTLFNIKVPVANMIREWALRIGLYLLSHQVAKRTDWIWIIDLTVELGTAKCLVILGISNADWTERITSGKGPLTHEDMSVIALNVLSSCNAETVTDCLNTVADRVGAPIQIVSDHGGDIKKGISDYLNQPHTSGIHTYDITHASACLLKRELKDDGLFQSFLAHMNQCRQQIQQTPLAFLMPPPQRSKARYLHLAESLKWAQRVLHYYHKGDFSGLGTHYCWDESAQERYAVLSQHHPPEGLDTIAGITYASVDAFCTAIYAASGLEEWDNDSAQIIQSADVSRRYVEAKFGWLFPFEASLGPYIERFDVVERVNHTLKHQGLSDQVHATLKQMLQSMHLCDEAKRFGQLLLEEVNQQAQGCLPGQKRLATSDVIESLFGKYKLFSQRSPIKEVGPLILLLPLCTAELSAELIQTALETIRSLDVKQWLANTVGPTMFAQRKAALSPGILDMENA